MGDFCCVHSRRLDAKQIPKCTVPFQKTLVTDALDVLREVSCTIQYINVQYSIYTYNIHTCTYLRFPLFTPDIVSLTNDKYIMQQQFLFDVVIRML